MYLAVVFLTTQSRNIFLASWWHWPHRKGKSTSRCRRKNHKIKSNPREDGKRLSSFQKERVWEEVGFCSTGNKKNLLLSRTGCCTRLCSLPLPGDLPAQEETHLIGTARFPEATREPPRAWWVSKADVCISDTDPSRLSALPSVQVT